MGVIEIIALVAELVPKVIGAGKSVADLRRSAGGIIADAEKTGKLVPDAALRLKALMDAQLAALDHSADEAGAGTLYRFDTGIIHDFNVRYASANQFYRTL